MKAIRNLLYTLRDNFYRIGRNGRVVLLCEPIWAIPNALYAPYVTQYMLAIGVTKSQVGLISAVGMVTGAIIGLFAGWITDRLGRRYTTLFSDSINWLLTTLLWALASNWLWFLAAAITNSFVRLVSVAWNCLMTEDTQPRNRLTIFWYLNIANTTAIFFTPLMTPLINRFGLPGAMRGVLLVSFCIYTVLFLVRHRLTRDTPISDERRAAARSTSPLDGLRSFGPLVARLIKNPVLLTFLMIRSLNFVQMNIKGSFFSIAVVQGMGFETSILGTINIVTGAVMLLSQFIILPKLTINNPIKPLLVSMSALLVAYLVLILAPAQSMAALMLTVVISAGGAVITNLLVDTLTSNSMPNDDRASLLALSSVVVVAITAPLQLLSGALAELPGIGPRLPMVIVMAIFVVCMALVVQYGRRHPAGIAEDQ